MAIAGLSQPGAQPVHVHMHELEIEHPHTGRVSMIYVVPEGNYEFTNKHIQSPSIICRCREGKGLFSILRTHAHPCRPDFTGTLSEKNGYKVVLRLRQTSWFFRLGRLQGDVRTEREIETAQ